MLPLKSNLSLVLIISILFVGGPLSYQAAEAFTAQQFKVLAK